MEHEFLKAEEVAATLRTSKMTVYRMIRAGHLDAIQVGRAYRIRRTSFEAFLKGGGVPE